MAVSMTLCLLSVLNTKRSLPARMLPPLVLMPFISTYNKHIGMYGVHRKIDEVL